MNYNITVNFKTMKNSTILSALFFTILLSCNKQTDNNNQKLQEYLNPDGTEKFLVPKNRFSNFIVLSTSLRNETKPTSVVYAFKGTLKNNTKNIYKTSSIRGELILVLENGNQLSCNQISTSAKVFGSDALSKYKYNWKPNEDWVIDELKSCEFSTEYFDYPVKEVFTQYYIKVQDQINNTSEEILVSQRDVTERWLRAKEKAKNNNSDCEDNIFSISKFIDAK